MAATSAFNQADLNQDGRLSLGEFSNFVGQNLGGSANNTYGATTGVNSFDSYSSSSYGAGGNLGLGGGVAGAYDSASSYGASGSLGLAGGVAGGYDSASSYGATGGFGSAGGVAAGGYDSSSSYSAGGVGYGTTGGYGVSANESTSTTAVQSYPTDAQGLFQDSNPQIIRRPASGGPLTYTQNIRVRFLQPPPIPPPGPLIIKEVRPPQPPAPPPLRVRQQAPSLPQPPPLVLRERPPVVPASVASQTVVRRLAALPVPPRSVIIERLPALPARPRDIIIERWVPYGAAAKRRTIVQRAAAAQQYASPRNVIVQYETAQVRIARQFQKLGVQAENPASYVQRYGAQLLDSVTLVQQARAAGVVEDISPPVMPGSFAATEGQFSATGGASGAGGLTGQGYGGVAGEINFEASAGGIGYNGVVAGLESPAAASAHIGGAGEGPTGYGAAPVLSAAASYGGLVGETVSNYSAGSTSGAGLGFTSTSLFNAADANHDGVLSQGEFARAGY